MNSKTKKILGIVSNVLVVVILAFVVLITFSIILSRGQGKNYTALFGRSYVAVQSDSMERDSYDDFVYPHDVEGFKKGDLIQIRVLSFEERGNLKVGDVVSYRFDIDGDGEKNELNTHRIVAYTDSNMDGVIDYYTLQGDKVGAPLDQNIPANLVIGKYEGHKIAGFGKAIDFFHSPAGFFVCVVLPSLLIVAYFAVNLVLTIKSVKSAYKEEESQNEKEKMREELMKELREQGKIVEETPSGTPAEEQHSEGEGK